MSDFDDAVDAMTSVVVRTKYDVFQPPELYAADLVRGLVEIGYAVKPWREPPAVIKEATAHVLEKYGDALKELA